MFKQLTASILVSSAVFLTAGAHADHHADMEGSHDLGVWADDQSVAEGTVTAERIVAENNGWMVVHRTDDSHKPGPVVGYAPLKAGENTDIAAILTEEVSNGDMLMLMLHGEDGGNQTGVFEYTLGASEDGPVKVDGNLVMAVITAQ
ncbi:MULTISPECIES: hypothetical protein [Halomonas]|uniref:DUF7282 domain-containing protein n=1 Tax=Halomonas TaxID=2745 RepID=UPI001C95BC21|nr:MULTISPECIES: hypothetical protein [Halomonas]MBY6206830.1 hypothetical protein [Halomonas sp. DP3Y7-2]MBY6230524.1 hypothetical protein [Halomonas sp. DP3Y7-1]MCA0916810.1 hypothetical protein [Halomonas denitrificans]